MTNKLNKEMIDNIKNYSDEIETLPFVEAVRTTFGMYLGAQRSALLQCIKEVFQNSIDEMQKKESPCTEIWLTFDERNQSTLVVDNGRGIPHGRIIDIFTKSHTSSNYTKKPGEYSSGRNGIGSKATNAVSEKFIVESVVLGKGVRVEFYDGYPWDKGEVPIKNPSIQQGTSIYFIPSFDVLGDYRITATDVLLMIKKIMQLTDLGSIVHFKGILKDGKEYVEDVINEDGILAGLIMKTERPLIKPIHFADDTGYMKAEVILTYDSDDITNGEDITSFSNFCPTVSGTHEDGLVDGVVKFFRDYMNKIYLTSSNKKKKNKLTINATDIKTGLKAVIAVAHLEPVFTGQAKDILSNEDMHAFVKDLTLRSLQDWSKSNPKDLEKVCKYLKEVGELRTKTEEGKIKLSDKYKTSSLSNGLPMKYKKPNGTKNLELIIVEGDSAGGSAKTSRDFETQGIYPIRGKLPNAFLTTREKLLGNEEVAGLIALLGGTYGKKFDINKVPFEYIIFTPDKDPDGDHIATLLLKIFLVLFPDLIKAGRVYKAMPPLFGLRDGKKFKFFTDRYDYVLYTQKLFSKNNVIEDLKGNRLSQKELSQLLYTNTDYVYDLEKLSNKFALEPKLVELVLLNKDLPINKLKKVIMEEFRFVKDIEKNHDSIVIEGLIGNKYQTFILNNKFLYEAKDVLRDFSLNLNHYVKINGKVSSLYELMKLFEGYIPKNLTRFKGLGEMNPQDLYESTLNKENRVLTRYTIESAKEEIENIRYMESNKNSLLSGITVTRSDLL